MEAEYYGVSTKYDGHFYLLSYDGNKAALTNHGGTVIDDLPLLKEATALLKGKCKAVVLAGELYLHKEGERTRSFDMTAALADKSAAIFLQHLIYLAWMGMKYLWILRHWTKSLTLCCLEGNHYML